LHRTIGAVEDWAPNAVSFLAAPTHVQQAIVARVPGLAEKVERARAYLFPGWLTLLLAVLAIGRKPARDSPLEPPLEALRPPAAAQALDPLILLVAAAALAIRVRGGFEWTLAGVTVSAHGVGRAALVLGVVVLLRLALAGLAPFAYAGPFQARI